MVFLLRPIMLTTADLYVRKMLPVFLLSLFFLGGCASGIDPELYRAQEPAFDVAGFFTGNIKARGIVQNRRGDITQRFTVDISGQYEDDRLVLDETFEYSVGEGPLSRQWVLVNQGNGRWSGKANDIESTATGQTYGNAFNLNYTMQVPVGGRMVAVRVEDWMWAMDESTIVNRSYVKKLGITFAEITIFMQRI